jgi:hypothetical protein
LSLSELCRAFDQILIRADIREIEASQTCRVGGDTESDIRVLIQIAAAICRDQPMSLIRRSKGCHFST